MYDSEAKNRCRRILKDHLRWLEKVEKRPPRVAYLDGPDHHETKMYLNEMHYNPYNLIRIEENKVIAGAAKLLYPEIRVLNMRLGVTNREARSGRIMEMYEPVPNFWSLDFDGPLGEGIENALLQLPNFLAASEVLNYCIYVNFMVGRERKGTNEYLKNVLKPIRKITKDKAVGRAVAYTLYLTKMLTGETSSLKYESDPDYRMFVMATQGYRLFSIPEIVIYTSDSGMDYISMFFRFQRCCGVIGWLKYGPGGIEKMANELIIDLRKKSRHKPAERKSGKDIIRDLVMRRSDLNSTQIYEATGVSPHVIAGIKADVTKKRDAGQCPVTKPPNPSKPKSP